MPHIVALHTYGTQVQQGRSCLKCTHEVPIILKRLFGDRAINLTPLHATYAYFHVPGVCLIHNHLVLHLTDAEKEVVETLTRNERTYPQIYLWENGNWYEFPKHGQTDYRLGSKTGGTYPPFTGTNAPYLAPSSAAETVSSTSEPSPGTGISITRSENEGNGRAWWWISGDTRPKKEILKAAGARWSKRRTAWYYIGQTLPAAIAALAEAPATVALDAVFEAAVADDPVEQAHRTAPNTPPEQKMPPSMQPAWFSTTLPDDAQYSPTGERLVFSKLSTADGKIIVYAAEYKDGQVFGCTVREDQSTTVEWGWHSLDALRKVKLIPTDDFEATPVSTLVPNFVAASAQPRPGNWLELPQTYIGRVNVVGDCYCYGLVVDRRPPSYKNIPIYLSVAGPATSVEALWARLSQGKELAVMPDGRQAVTIYLQPNGAGLYTRFQKKIDTVGIDHLILVHEDLSEPDYQATDTPTTYVLCTSPQQKIAKLGDVVRHVVKIAVYDPWLDYVYEEGLQRGLVRVCGGYGSEALAVRLDPSRWTDLITSGLARKHLVFP